MGKKVKNLNEVAKIICQLEGKKVEVNIAQVKEILSILSDIIQIEREEYGISNTMIQIMENGLNRVKKANKKNARKVEAE